MLPMILNVVVDAVIHHWVTVVTPTEAGTGGLGLKIIDLAAYFYANDILVELTQPERLQRTFNVLNSLFDRVELRTNTANMVGMVCQPFHAPGRVLEEDYKRQTTGKGPMFRVRQRRRVEFLECGVEVAMGLLMTHQHIQHGVVRGGGHPPPPPPRDSRTYLVSFPKNLSRIRCPEAG